MFSRRLAFVAVLLLLMLLHGTAGASAFIFSSKEEKEGTKGTEAAELGVGSELLGFKAYEDMRRQGQDTFLLLQKKSKEEVEEKERGEEEERGLSLSANKLLKSLFSLKQKESIGCWTQCLGQMEKSCNAKTDDEMKKLAFMFTNCHLEESGLGRVTWDRMKRNEKAFSAYTVYRIHAWTICHSIEKRSFDDYIKFVARELLSVSETSFEHLKSILVIQQDVQEGVSDLSRNVDVVGEQLQDSIEKEERLLQVQQNIHQRVIHLSQDVEVVLSGADEIQMRVSNLSQDVQVIQDVVKQSFEVSSKIKAFLWSFWEYWQAACLNLMDAAAYLSFIAFTWLVGIGNFRARVIVLVLTFLHLVTESRVKTVLKGISSSTTPAWSAETSAYIQWSERLVASLLVMVLAKVITSPKSSSREQLRRLHDQLTFQTSAIERLSLEIGGLASVVSEVYDFQLQTQSQPRMAKSSGAPALARGKRSCRKKVVKVP